jgi:hypothetical protein
MTNDKQRFDVRARELANKAAVDILKECPELGSVAVVFGWELGPAASSEVPAGVLVNRDGRMDLARAQTFMQQLLVMFNSVAATVFDKVASMTEFDRPDAADGEDSTSDDSS